MHSPLKVIIISECTGGDCVENQSGTIKSPNHPENYANHEDVTVPLEVPSGSTIRLTFSSFDVEFEGSCNYDSLTVLDTDGSSLGKLYGSTLPAPIQSSGHKMTLVFKSDNSITSTGYEASWTKVDPVASGAVTSDTVR